MSVLNEEQLKKIALAFEFLKYEGADKIYREYKQRLYDDIPLLEYGDFGGNCRQLGVYSYRGFDVCITGEDSEAPEMGGEFTIGVYGEGDCDAIELWTLNGFCFESAVKEVNNLIDFIFKNHTYLGKANGLEMSKVTFDEFVGLPEFKVWKESECTCGAKHTSNPEFHMSWCDKK